MNFGEPEGYFINPGSKEIILPNVVENGWGIILEDIFYGEKSIK
jgi:hypothetical protein